MDTESSTGGTDTVPSTATLVTSLDTTDSAGTAEGTSSDGDATDSLDSSGTSTSTTGETETETDGTTGDEVIPGQTVGQLVTAGTRSTSTSYTLVYTFGQPSQLQSTHQSTNYRLQGGLIGANGSPP